MHYITWFDISRADIFLHLLQHPQGCDPSSQPHLKQSEPFLNIEKNTRREFNDTSTSSTTNRSHFPPPRRLLYRRRGLSWIGWRSHELTFIFPKTSIAPLRSARPARPLAHSIVSTYSAPICPHPRFKGFRAPARKSPKKVFEGKKWERDTPPEKT